MENVGRYQLLERLGQGGMGIVYRGFDTLLQRVVAVKLISRPIDTAPELRERFLREARAAGQLSHKNIITIYDMGEHLGQPYLAMEFLQGEDLQRRLSGPTKISLRRKVRLAIECCEALEYAHTHGVIHRDIKPSNIFLTEDGSVKVLDFGLARLVTSELTNSNMLMGTLNYMSPEQVRGERVDHRADVFSLGVVLYELLGGRKAFEGDSFASTLYKILQEVPEPLRNIDASLPETLVAIVERALAKPRDERYQRMSDLRSDLSGYADQLAHADVSSDPPFVVARRVPQSDAATTAITPLPALASGPHTPLPLDVPRSGGDRRLRMGWPQSVAAVATIVAVVGAGAWIASRRWRAAAPENHTTAAAVQTAGVADQHRALVRQAAQALSAREYASARGYADQALRISPTDPEARDIRDRARTAVETVDRRLSDARASYDAGKLDDASRAAGDVLALAPGNEEARRLMDAAVAQSRGRNAADARRRMMSAKAAARTAGAPSLASDQYAAARQAEDDASRLSRAGSLTEATARFYEAAGLYGSAEVSARSEAAAARTRQPSPAVVAPPIATSTATPRDASPAATPGPTPGETHQPSPSPPATSGLPPVEPEVPAAKPPGAPAPPPPSPSAPPASAPSAAPGATAGGSAAAPPLPPATPEPAAPAEEQIRDLIGRYRSALESRNIEALERIWPGLAGTQREAMRNEFQHATRIHVDIASPEISVTGNSGTVRFTRRYELLTVDGQRLQSQSVATMNLRRSGGSWIIERIRFDRIR